jgi:hypothetical protein
MSFTADEIQASVERLVRATLRRQHGNAGEADTEATFSDMNEAAASLFMMTPEAPYYVAYLGSRRLEQRLKETSTSLVSLKNLLSSYNRRVEENPNLSPLTTMGTALGALDSALSVRTTGMRGLSGIPAYQQFLGAVDEFLEGAAQNVKDGGEIVPTPSEIRKLIPSVLRVTKEQFEEVKRIQVSLCTALTDYSTAELSHKASKNVAAKTRRVLAEHEANLSKLSGEKKSEQLRSVVLDVLAARSVFNAVGSFTAPKETKVAEGSAVPYADATYLATPASFLSDVAGPYILTSSNYVLSFLVDGSLVEEEVLLNPSFKAQVDGVAGEPFDFHIAGIDILDNREFVVNVSGVDRTVNFTTDAITSAAEAVTQLNAVLNAYGITASAVGETGSKRIRLEATSFDVNVTIEVVASAASDTLGFATGYVWQCLKTPAWQVAADVNGKSTKVTAALSFSSLLNLYTRTDPANLPYVRKRPTGTTSVLSPTSLRFTITDGNTTTGVSVGDVLILPDASSWTISAVTGGYVDATNGVVTPTVQVGISAVIGTPKPANIAFVHCYKMRAVATVTQHPSIAGRATVTFTDGSLHTLVYPGTVQVLMMDGANANTVWNIVSAPDSSSLLVDSSLDAVTGTNVEVLLVPDLSLVGFVEGDILRIMTTENKGDYDIGANDYSGTFTNKGALRIVQTLTLSEDIGFLPGQNVRALAKIGKGYVEFKSASAGTDTKLETVGTASGFSTFFAGAKSTVGSSPWLEVSSTTAKTLAVGDAIRYFEDDYNVATQESQVVSLRVVDDKTVAAILPVIGTDQEWDFDATVPPYARVVDQSYRTYDGFRVCAEDWASVIEASFANYFYDLERLTSALLHNRSAADFQVNDILAKILELENILLQENAPDETLTLQYAVTQFQMKPVQEVDTLLRSLREKGAERAVDVLLEGKFKEFFAMDFEDTSYAGAMLKATRDLTREDMPIRKDDRAGRKEQRMLVEAESPDYEIDQSDIDETSGVDVLE